MFLIERRFLTKKYEKNKIAEKKLQRKKKVLPLHPHSKKMPLSIC
jgi:hypothetical protein